jgi:hypothetical protein
MENQNKAIYAIKRMSENELKIDITNTNITKKRSLDNYAIKQSCLYPGNESHFAKYDAINLDILTTFIFYGSVSVNKPRSS